MEALEKMQQAICTSAAGAQDVAERCNKDLDELKNALCSVAGAVWGREVALDGPARTTKPVMELLSDMASTLSQACTEEMLDAVKSLATQVLLHFTNFQVHTSDSSLLHFAPCARHKLNAIFFFFNEWFPR